MGFQRHPVAGVVLPRVLQCPYASLTQGCEYRYYTLVADERGKEIGLVFSFVSKPITGRSLPRGCVCVCVCVCVCTCVLVCELWLWALRDVRVAYWLLEGEGPPGPCSIFLLCIFII